MRKITLMCALALSGLTSVAQTLTQGWYRFEAKEGAALSTLINENRAWVLNCENEFRQSVTNYYPVKYAAYDAEKDPTSWLYVTPVDGNTYTVQSLNGHYITTKVLASRTAANLNIIPGGDNNYVTIGDYWSIYTNNGAESPYAGASWRASDNRFEPTALTTEELAGYDIYTVSITGDTPATEIGNDTRVTCTNAANKGIASVYANGRFVFPAGTAVGASDFTAPDKAGHKTEITVSAESKMVVLEYVEMNYAELLADVVAKAKAALGKTGVGCTPADSPKRTELQNAITAAEALATVQESDVTAIQTALTTYCTVTNADLVMPEDGKVYTLTFRPADVKNGTYRYMNFNGTALETVATTLEAELPVTARFVCHKWMDGETAKHVLVPAYGEVGGKYLGFQGMSDEYIVNASDILVNTLVGTNSGMIIDKSAENLFGYLYFTFVNRSATDTQAGVSVINESTGSVDKSTAPFLNGSYTSAIIMREVEGYPNTVALKPAAGVDGAETIGTFSAPYAALVPEGVTAYTVASAGGTTVWMDPIEEGKVIPANTGVVLAATDAAVTSAFMVPAAGEERAVVESNLLGHSAGADKVIPAEEDAYVLTAVNGVVGFYRVKADAAARNLSMNKAYLTVPSSVAETEAFTIRFGFDGETSVRCIRAVEMGESGQEVYDLFGRRMTGTLKTGVYIRGGKKFMVK